MVKHLDDRWLWLGSGIFIVVAVRAVAYGLHTIAGMAAAPSSAPPSTPQAASASPRARPCEDAIRTESLRVLATSPNVEIRKAATKLLCRRFQWNEVAMGLLLPADVVSDDEDTRERAQLVVRLLQSQENKPQRHLRHSDSASSAFSGSLHGESGGTASIRPSRAMRAQLADSDEAELRRRRREAVVVHEGDQPLSQDDIIVAGASLDANEAREFADELARVRAEAADDSD